jgi:hypothetical protein
MWLIARILISLVAIVYRLFIRRTPKDYDLLHGDLPYAERVETAKDRPPKRFFETPVDSAFICVLSKETALDRFFKAIGFGEELQVADPAFNKMIYVLGDHPLTKAYLTSRPDARLTILKLISAGAKSIYITGKSLRLELPDSFDSTSTLDDLAVLARELRAVQGDVRSRFADPYYDTALIIQAVVVGLLAFALLGAIESFHLPYYHVNVEPLIRLSLIVTGGFMLALVGVIWLLLRRSSYAPRLVTENCFLMVPLAFAGFQIVSDVNRTWDRSQGWVVSYRVEDLHEHAYWGRGIVRAWRRILNAPKYTYRVRISALTPTTSYPLAMPGSFQIDYGLFRALSRNKQLSMEIGEGALGFPWCREMWAGPPEP